MSQADNKKLFLRPIIAPLYQKSALQALCQGGTWLNGVIMFMFIWARPKWLKSCPTTDASGSLLSVQYVGERRAHVLVRWPAVSFCSALFACLFFLLIAFFYSLLITEITQLRLGYGAGSIYFFLVVFRSPSAATGLFFIGWHLFWDGCVHLVPGSWDLRSHLTACVPDALGTDRTLPQAILRRQRDDEDCGLWFPTLMQLWRKNKGLSLFGTHDYKNDVPLIISYQGLLWMVI